MSSTVLGSGRSIANPAGSRHCLGAVRWQAGGGVGTGLTALLTVLSGFPNPPASSPLPPALPHSPLCLRLLPLPVPHTSVPRDLSSRLCLRHIFQWALITGASGTLVPSSLGWPEAAGIFPSLFPKAPRDRVCSSVTSALPGAPSCLNTSFPSVLQGTICFS